MISKEEIKHIAGLARIGMDEEELGNYSEELSGILEWIEKLKEVDTENVETTDHITGIKNIDRSDEVENSFHREEIGKLFPQESNGYNKVKSVL